MRLTIKGITDSTITFNTLGIVVRGNSGNMKLYPESIARHIDIDSEAKLTEVNSLVNAGFVVVEVEDAVQKKVEIREDRLATPKNAKPISVAKSKMPDRIEKKIEKEIEPKDAVLDVLDTDIEDAPSKLAAPSKEEKTEVENPKANDSEETEETEECDNSDNTEKSRRGRPVGAKDGKPRKVVSKTKTKKVVKSVKSVVASNDGESTENTKSFVMTASGAVEAKAARTFSGEIADGERTQASIDAMKQLEKEELEATEEAEEINESDLDPSEQMGRDAIISTGEKTASRVKMQKSIIPEAKQISDRGITFIDEVVTDIEDEQEQVFIDEDRQDDDGIDFLEI